MATFVGWSLQFADELNRKVEERAAVVIELRKTIVKAFSRNEKPSSPILHCCSQEPLNLTADPRYPTPVRQVSADADGPARWAASSSVDRRKYCQHGSADDGWQFITPSVYLRRTNTTTRCDDRPFDVLRRIFFLLKSTVRGKVPEGSTLYFGDTRVSL